MLYQVLDFLKCIWLFYRFVVYLSVSWLGAWGLQMDIVIPNSASLANVSFFHDKMQKWSGVEKFTM